MEKQSAVLFINCPWENQESNITLKSVEIIKPQKVGNYVPKEAKVGSVDPQGGNSEQSWIGAYLLDNSIFKAYIPWYLYKPPYGYPRDVNPLELRQFASNPYIFSVVKAIQDEVANTKWDVKQKEEYADDKVDDLARRSILHFFDHPNGNPKENFKTILKAWIRDICEIGNCIGVKVFNKAGKFTQLVARDASTFLLNTDVFGMLDKRADFVSAPTPDLYQEGIPTELVSEYSKITTSQDIMKLNDKVRNPDNLSRQTSYDLMYSQNAAFFQYGWTAGARPVPFGKREILWCEMNPRSDNIYPLSPISILWNSILTLVYGLEYNLDFYLNNNLPNGLLYFEGMPHTQADTYRAQLNNIFMEKDEYGNKKKKHFKVPLTGYKPEFIQMQMSSKEMEIIEQQKWFTKLIYSCFGVNSNELGFIDDINRANGETQERATVRKMIRPFLTALEDAINGQLMPEFEHPEFEFKFDDYDLDEDTKKHTLLEQELRMGIKSPEMVAKELGIDFTEVKKFQDEQQQKMNEQNQAVQDNQTQTGNTPDLNKDWYDNGQ